MIHHKYPVHEYFMTWQGEGVHIGIPAFFIRLFGCPVHCPWCDSAGTWHKDFIPKDIKRLDCAELYQIAAVHRPPIVVLTGGEPAIHPLLQFTDWFREDEFDDWSPRLHIETSGAFPIQGDFNWITCSPKRWALPINSAVQSANEFKFIIETPEDIEFYTKLILERGYAGDAPIWLHPEWSKHTDKTVLNAISNTVKTQHRKFPYRAGWQLHKNYQVDALDSRSRPLVPLGGNPALGY